MIDFDPEFLWIVPEELVGFLVFEVDFHVFEAYSPAFCLVSDELAVEVGGDDVLIVNYCPFPFTMKPIPLKLPFVNSRLILPPPHLPPIAILLIISEVPNVITAILVNSPSFSPALSLLPASLVVIGPFKQGLIER